LSQHRANAIRPEERELELQRRWVTRERRKVIGVLAIAILILALLFLRFGRTIPWGAR